MPSPSKATVSCSAGASAVRRRTLRTRASTSRTENGLGDVVVGPEVQSGDRVVFGVLRRAEDHRDLRRRGVVFQQPGHPEAAHFAHHDIEQDQRITLGVHFEGLLGAVRHIDLVTLDFEVELQDLAQRLFVIDHQDFVFCHTYEV